MSPAAQERRRSRRFNLALPVKILQLDQQAVELESLTRNVSSVGAYFALSVEDVKAGSTLEFHLTLESAEAEPVTLKCRGRIARVEERADDLGAMVAATIDRYQFQR